MHDGHLMQVGTPTDLYSLPTSLFVAKFLGETNTLTGSVVRADGDAVVDVGGGLELSAAIRSDCPPGQEVVYIVRPEKLQTETDGLPNRVRAQVDSIIFQGSFVRATLATDDFELLYEGPTDSFTARTGDSIEIGWHPDDVLLLPAGEDA
jgi:ABC-type Fe3+/spermidine/putrescine transport system ATPase subunit